MMPPRRGSWSSGGSGGNDGVVYAYPRLTPVVRAVLIALAIGTIATVFEDEARDGVSLLYRWLAVYPRLVLHGQVWRLLTATFLPPPNGGLLDVVFGGVAVYFFGTALEEQVGSRRFAWMIAACAVLPLTLGALCDGFHPSFFTQPSSGPAALALSLTIAWGLRFPMTQVFLLPPQIAGRYAPSLRGKTLAIGIGVLDVGLAIAHAQQRSAAATISAAVVGWAIGRYWDRLDDLLDRRRIGRAQSRRQKSRHGLRVIAGGLGDAPPKDKKLLN